MILESFPRHKGKLAIMCQVGTLNFPETLELLDHAASAGFRLGPCAAALLLQESIDRSVGLVAYYEPILKAARLPVLLYNIPQVSGVAVTPELLRRLSSFEQALWHEGFVQQGRCAGR